MRRESRKVALAQDQRMQRSKKPPIYVPGLRGRRFRAYALGFGVLVLGAIS